MADTPPPGSTPPGAPPPETPPAPAPAQTRRERRAAAADSRKGKDDKKAAAASRRADDDIFIDEVSEELRKERLMAMAWRYGPFIAAALVAVIVWVGVSEYLKASSESAAQTFGETLLSAADQREADPAGAADAFAAARGEAGTAEARAIAAFYEADARVEAGDAAAALDLLAEVSGDSGLAPRYRQLAVLKSVMVEGDAIETDAALAALGPLTETGAPFRALALEQIALTHLRAGALADARGAYEEAAGDARATNALRQRARLALDAIPSAPAASE